MFSFSFFLLIVLVPFKCFECNKFQYRKNEEKNDEREHATRNGKINVFFSVGCVCPFFIFISFDTIRLVWFREKIVSRTNAFVHKPKTTKFKGKSTIQHWLLLFIVFLLLILLSLFWFLVWWRSRASLCLLRWTISLLRLRQINEDS